MKTTALIFSILVSLSTTAQTKYIMLTGQSNSVAVNGTTAAFNDSMMMTIGMHTIKNVMPFDSNYTHQFSRVKGAGWSSNNLMLGGVGALGIAIQKYYKDSLNTKTYLVQGGFQGKDIRTFLSPANKYDASTQYGRTLLRCFGGGIQDSITTVIYYQYESD